MDNYKKIVIWGVNIALFVVVVFMGITQAGLGAEIAQLEDETFSLSEKKHKLSESILLRSSNNELTEKSEELGYIKPDQVVYIDSLDSFASLLP